VDPVIKPRPVRPTKVLGSTTFRVGRTGRGLISGSTFHTGGRNVGLTTIDNPGQIRDIGSVGKEQGYHSFATLSWNRWSFAAMFGERRISVPTGFLEPTWAIPEPGAWTPGISWRWRGIGRWGSPVP